MLRGARSEFIHLEILTAFEGCEGRLFDDEALETWRMQRRGNIIERTLKSFLFTKCGERPGFLFFTFHGANGTVAFAELEVRGVVDFKGYFLTMTAAFVLYSCVHDLLLFRSIPFLRVTTFSFQVSQSLGTTGKYWR